MFKTLCHPDWKRPYCEFSHFSFPDRSTALEWCKHDYKVAISRRVDLTFDGVPPPALTQWFTEQMFDESYMQNDAIAYKILTSENLMNGKCDNKDQDDDEGDSHLACDNPMEGKKNKVQFEDVDLAMFDNEIHSWIVSEEARRRTDEEQSKMISQSHVSR